VLPGEISPARPVPAHIPRPDYARLGGTRRERQAVGFTDNDFVARMRAAGQAAAEVLEEVGAAIAVGVTTDELDAVCHQACIDRGGYPSPLNYNGFPKSLCTSVNEVICHGIPDSRPLENGDIVNCDVTIYLNGVHGDTNATFLVGDVDAESRRLVKVTEEAMYRGIDSVRPGRPISDIGKAIQTHAERHGFGVVREFVGHGIGTEFHMPPNVPHYYDPSATFVMRPGMTFTIEPMITVGDWHAVMWGDGWTAVTADLRRTAQFEHTVLVTEDGVEVLTQRR
jgi:methionyl aminopeptidase